MFGGENAKVTGAEIYNAWYEQLHKNGIDKSKRSETLVISYAYIWTQDNLDLLNHKIAFNN